MEKTQQIAAVVMASDLVQQPLIGLVFEQAGSLMVSHFLFQRPHSPRVIRELFSRIVERLV